MPPARVQAAELAQQAAERSAEAERAEAVRAQRAAMLREAAYLRKYLPRGALADEGELRLLDEAAEEAAQCELQAASAAGVVAREP